MAAATALIALVSLVYRTKAKEPAGKFDVLILQFSTWPHRLKYSARMSHACLLEIPSTCRRATKTERDMSEQRWQWQSTKLGSGASQDQNFRFQFLQRELAS